MELALTRRSAAEHAVLARKQQAESDQAEMLRLAGLGPADLPLLQTMPEVSDRFGVRRRYCLLAQVCSRVATANRSLDTQPCRSRHADVLHAHPSHPRPPPAPLPSSPLPPWQTEEGCHRECCPLLHAKLPRECVTWRLRW